MIQVTLQSYVACAGEASRGLVRNWPVMVGAVALFFLMVLARNLLAPLGMSGDLILSLLRLAALSFYFSWLGETARRQKIKFQDLRNFDSALFFALIGVSFVLWVADWVVQSLTMGMHVIWPQAFLGLATVFLFNALPEVVYLDRQESLAAYQEAFKFTRDNWIEWYAPFVLLIAPFLLASPERFMFFWAASSPLLPSALVLQVPPMLLPAELGDLGVLCGLVLTHWFMLFRAHLYRDLESGSRRQRAFRARQ